MGSDRTARGQCQRHCCAERPENGFHGCEPRWEWFSDQTAVSSPAVELHDDVALRLAGLDQRYTPGRRAIVEVLAKSDRPLTVPELLASAGRRAGDAVPQSS